MKQYIERKKLICKDDDMGDGVNVSNKGVK